MADIRVLVVDDSAAMRALFCDILDQAKGVEVVGAARNADEARDLIAERKPQVLTLDVEMPGMTGMEFLEELMGTNPLPVIMLSSVTQEGTGTAQKALSLGAVDCFPKPLHTSPEEFAKTVAKLGKIVIAAAENGPGKPASAQQAQLSGSDDGTIIALVAATESLETVRETIAAFRADCPATVILVDADEERVERAIDRLRPSVACKIETGDGDHMLTQGTVYLAYRKDRHVVIENDFAPILKSIDRDPIGGCRPSADMFLASVARSGLEAKGAVLAGSSNDGIRGLAALAKAGWPVFLENGDDGMGNPRFEKARAMVEGAQCVSSQDIIAHLLSHQEPG